jgi:hypothetical protein
MHRPDVAARAHANRGPHIKSAEGLANISRAAQARMSSDRNPMRDPAKYQAAMAKTLSRVQSKNETHFFAWAASLGIELSRTGDGSFWIGRRNPDARIPGQRKLLEITQKECFIGKRKPRTVDGYALPTIRHYQSKGWQCLVIFKGDHRSSIPAALEAVIRDYASPESNWSGVWHFDQLIESSAFPDGSLSTTSPVRP